MYAAGLDIEVISMLHVGHHKQEAEWRVLQALAFTFQLNENGVAFRPSRAGPGHARNFSYILVAS